MIGRQSVLPAGGRATIDPDPKRGVLRWLPAAVVVGALLAMSIGSVSSVLAAEKTITIVTGDGSGAVGTADPNFSFAVGDDEGSARIAANHPAWKDVPGARWINASGITRLTAGCTSGDLGCRETVTYSATFDLPPLQSASISVKVLADNQATVSLNGHVLLTQPAPDGESTDNFRIVSTDGSSDLDDFEIGTNTLTITNLDGEEGVANGISLKATITYEAAPLVISFVSPSTRAYDGTTDAAISSCTVAPATADLDCAAAPTATASYASKNIGTHAVSADVSDFVLSGPNVDAYTNVSVADTTAAITKRAVTVTAGTDDRVANGTTSSTGVPTITTGSLATGDTAVYSQSYAQAAAGYPIALTPVVISIKDGTNVDMRGNYQVTTASADGRIRPGPVASLTFTTQPIDTQRATPIYSVCKPSGGAAPCALTTASLNPSSPILVTAKDAFGNLAGLGAPGASASGALATADVKVVIKETDNSGTLLTPAAGVSTSAGVANFTDILHIDVARTSTKLFASSAAATATSTAFQVVADAAACDGTTCDSLATGGAAGSTQKTFGRIKTTNDFYDPTSGQNVLLTSQFATWEGGRCATSKTKLGLTSEVKVQGNGVSPTSPNFFVTLIFPKETIKNAGLASRPALDFDVCLGATWLGAGSPTPWKAKPLTLDTLQDSLAETAGSKTYWGWVPLCLRVNLSPLLNAQQRATNPCIELKTKSVALLRAELVGRQGLTLAEFNAIGAKDDDVMIVLRKPWPWDGKFSTGLR